MGAQPCEQRIAPLRISLINTAACFRISFSLSRRLTCFSNACIWRCSGVKALPAGVTPCISALLLADPFSQGTGINGQ
ncbi:hypothetical protein, partial [Xenorhabdus nematophila]|uniref:hypothetical protein n=1 Tax=Xenorhabdus nematophila TaxID=628 RepID=UPI001F3BE722